MLAKFLIFIKNGNRTNEGTSFYAIYIVPN